MVVFPIIAFAISGVFAILLFRQYARRRRIAQLAWGVALLQFAVASAAVGIAVADAWDPTLYRTFWVFGALLNVAWLAVGSIALVARKAIGYGAFALVVAGTAYALASVYGSDLNASALVTDSIPAGRDVWGRGTWQLTLVNFYSIIPYFIVVGIAVWSSLPRRGMRPPAERARGNALIAIGVTIVAIGGFALRRVGRGSAFSIALAIGVCVMFAGFLLASRPPRHRVAEPGDSPT